MLHHNFHVKMFEIPSEKVRSDAYSRFRRELEAGFAAFAHCKSETWKDFQRSKLRCNRCKRLPCAELVECGQEALRSSGLFWGLKLDPMSVETACSDSAFTSGHKH